MSRPAAVRSKICGLTSNEDARWADEHGADYLGVVLSGGHGRSVDPAEAVAVLAGTSALGVAVLVDESPREAVRKADAIGASVIQLHGSESVEDVRTLRALGERRLWKAVRARSVGDVRSVVDRYGSLVDGVVVEGWKEGVVGGGGATLRLDPAEVRAAIPAGLDFVLAGGLTPESVAEAVALFQPDVVDVSSGVEAAVRRKDPERVRAFVREAGLAPHVRRG